MDHLVVAALARSRRPRVAPPARLGTWAGLGLGAAVGLVLVLGASAVVRWGRADERTVGPGATQAPAVVEPERHEQPTSERSRDVAPTPAPIPEDEAAPSPTPSPSPVPSRRRGAHEAEASPSQPLAEEAADDDLPLDAAAMFQRATEARRRGEAASALEGFTALRRRHPQSHEATASWVLSGRLLLERSRPAAALECFDAYLEISGAATLVPEALRGRATALEQLGRATEAQAQWRDIVRRFPRSSSAMTARARLEGESLP